MTERREAILDTFSSLVANYGLGKTTMQDIARAMGISIGTIYNEFADKEDLILAFWQRVEQRCIAHLDSLAGRPLPPAQLLRLLMLEHIRLFDSQLRDNRGIYDLMMESTISYLGKSIFGSRQIIQQALITRVAGVLRLGAESGAFAIPGDAVVIAGHFVAAFTEYLVPPLVMARQSSEVLQEAGAMFDFVVLAIAKNPGPARGEGPQCAG